MTVHLAQFQVSVLSRRPLNPEFSLQDLADLAVPDSPVAVDLRLVRGERISDDDARSVLVTRGYPADYLDEPAASERERRFLMTKLSFAVQAARTFDDPGDIGDELARDLIDAAEDLLGLLHKQQDHQECREPDDGPE